MPVDYPGASAGRVSRTSYAATRRFVARLVQEIRRMQRADGDDSGCQEVVVAEVDRVTDGGGNQRSQLGRGKGGAAVGMRDVDKVVLGFAEIGDRDVAGVENERVGAAE